MTDETPSLPRLRAYLLSAFAGAAIVMVFAYTQLLDYYFELGVNVRTLYFLEQTAEAYAEAGAAGVELEAPSDANLKIYRSLAEMPEELVRVFPPESMEHGELMQLLNRDDDGDDDSVPIETDYLCPEGVCDVLFLYPYQLGGDDWLYILHGIVGTSSVYDEFQFTERVAFAIAGLFAVVFALIAFLVIRSISGPLRRLERWSAELGSDGREEPVPALRFQELDTLARRLRFAFGRMRESVDKEKLFLRHASHELRTPIAILSANVELLDRLTAGPDRTDAEEAAFLRQYRALDDVQQLTETLLWVNRQSENMPATEAVDLREVLDSIIEDYRYLLEDRPVNLVIDGTTTVITAPAAAVRVVLSNLVRNAFQYTVEGEVRITLASQGISIENTNAIDPGQPAMTKGDEDYGFGLGLELVALLCKRLAWQYDTSETDHSRQTVVRFLSAG